MLLLLLLETRNWGLLMHQLLFLIQHMLLQLLLVRIPMRCGLQRRELALRARGGHSSAASAGKRLAARSDRRPGLPTSWTSEHFTSYIGGAVGTTYSIRPPLSADHTPMPSSELARGAKPQPAHPDI